MPVMLATVRIAIGGVVIVAAYWSLASAQGQNDCPQNAAAPAAAPVRSVMVRDGNNISTYYYAVSGNRAIFEGDIVLGDADALEHQAKLGPISSDDAGEARALVARNVIEGGARWPNATIPYQIEPGTPYIDDIGKALSTWSQKTGLKFVERTGQNAATYKNFVSFQRGTDPNACYSQSLGMSGGQQYVQLVNGCTYGVILHEIGHVLGLNHEQNRSDRGNYVDVLFRNIWPAYVYAFVQHPQTERDVGAYDLDSIMHYETTAFSCNGKPTIVSKSGSPVGQRTHLSDGDIAAIKKIYKLP